MNLVRLTLTLILLGALSLHAEDIPGLREPLKTVTEKYLVIQQKLASDSFDGVPASAAAMQTVMTAAPKQTFAPDFAKAVDALAAARDLHAARLVLPEVSDCLIAALARNKIETGSLHVVFCPMRKAYWLQTDGRTVHNPYYGAAMSDCGEFQRQF